MFFGISLLGPVARIMKLKRSGVGYITIIM